MFSLPFYLWKSLFFCSDSKLMFCCLIFDFFKFCSFSLLKGRNTPLSNSDGIYNASVKQSTSNIKNGINLSVILLNLKFYRMFQSKNYRRKQIYFFLFTWVFYSFQTSSWLCCHIIFSVTFLSHLLACYA